MKCSLPALAIVLAAGLPLAACAQQSNAAENGPPPEVRAQMLQAHDAAKTAAFNDLSAADRAKVQAIVDAINNGQQTDLRAAAQQIDAILTPAEAKAVLGERDTMMQTIRAAMPARPDGTTPNGQSGSPANGAPGGHRGGMMGNDAGRFLISLGVSREKMRELRRASMPQAGQSPQQPH